MNFVVGIIVVLAIIGFFVFKGSNKEEPLVNNEASNNEIETPVANTNAGTYEVYSPEKVTLASAEHDVVLFFRASWCPTCRALDKDIKNNLGNIPASLAILDVDYDNSQELKQKYGVTYQHTLVQVDAEGNMIKKWTGSPTLAKLVSEVQ